MICDHRNGNGVKMTTWFHRTRTVCDKCVHGTPNVPEYRPIRVAQMFKQMNYAAIEMRAMTGMMREVGMEFLDDEVMGTAEQFEEFKRRWAEKYPDRSFIAMYSEKGEIDGR